MRVSRNIALLILASALFLSSSSVAFALFHLDIGTSAGVTRVSGHGEGPLLGQYGVQASAGASFLGFILGATTEYRMVEQYTSSDDETGNYKGSYLSPVGIMAGLAFDPLLVKVDAKFLGTYELSQKTAAGDTTKLTDPFGLRFTLLYNYLAGIHIGVHYEYLHFATLEHSSDGEQDLDKNLRLDQWGMTLAFAL